MEWYAWAAPFVLVQGLVPSCYQLVGWYQRGQPLQVTRPAPLAASGRRAGGRLPARAGHSLCLGLVPLFWCSAMVLLFVPCDYLRVVPEGDTAGYELWAGLVGCCACPATRLASVLSLPAHRAVLPVHGRIAACKHDALIGRCVLCCASAWRPWGAVIAPCHLHTGIAWLGCTLASWPG